MSVEKAFMQLIQLLEQQSKYKVGCEKLHYTPYGRFYLHLVGGGG